MPRGVVRIKMPYGGGSTYKDIEPRFSSCTMHEHDMLSLSFLWNKIAESKHSNNNPGTDETRMAECG